MAVVRVAPTNGGTWQYHRGDWTTQSDASSQYDPNSNTWLGFPSDISETNSLLLHGNDQLRFLPHPEFYWSTSASPSIDVKAWDNSLGQFSNSSSFPFLLKFLPRLSTLTLWSTLSNLSGDQSASSVRALSRLRPVVVAATEVRTPPWCTTAAACVGAEGRGVLVATMLPGATWWRTRAVCVVAARLCVWAVIGFRSPARNWDRVTSA